MPAGQASTTWFPEMKEMLPNMWKSDKLEVKFIIKISQKNK